MFLDQKTDGVKSRGSLCGKRVDYSSRSVIGPDSFIDIDELGVPECIALHQTRSVKVTSFNRAHLAKSVCAGFGVRGGAGAVIDNTGRQRCLERLNAEHRKQIGDVLDVGWSVKRHLVDGDEVIFNRQPSLHKFSMMVHRVRIMPGNTFRLSPQATRPYNADYDGDEMNCHVVQRIDAQVKQTTSS